MAYYDALAAKWAELSGTTPEKLAALNAETVPGPRVDVTVPAVIGRLMISGAYLGLAKFAQDAFIGEAAHDAALGSAKMLMAQISIPNAPGFNMSDAENYAAIAGMMAAMVAYPSSGMSAALRDDLLGLCETTRPWWQANGYTSPFSIDDLEAAGGLE